MQGEATFRTCFYPFPLLHLQLQSTSSSRIPVELRMEPVFVRVIACGSSRENNLFVLVAAYEFYVILLCMAVGYFRAYHCLAFLQVVQRELINSAASL